MRRIIFKFLIASLFFLMPINNVFPDESGSQDKPVRLVLSDGTEMTGNIVSEDEKEIVFMNKSGLIIKIPKEKVKFRNDFTIVIGVEKEKRADYDPNGTRLFIAPTARSLKSGKGYFSVLELFFPTVGIGISDSVSFTGGISLFPGVDKELLYLSLRLVPIQEEGFNLAVGTMYFNVVPDFPSAGVGTFYSVITIGGYDFSLTAGTGILYRADMSDFSKPVFFFGGELRLSDSIKFISENWASPDVDGALLSFGLRFIGVSLSADLGFYYPLGANPPEGFPFIPLLSFTYNF